MFRALAVIATTSLAIVLGGCAEPPQSRTPLELQSIQAKEFETDKKIAFAATLSVFQDLGYIVNSASLDTGLISSQSPTKQSFVPFVGQVMRDTKATAFVEQVAANRTRVRLNFVDSQHTSSGYGMRGQRDTAIETPEVYQNAFTRIQQGIFLRKNVN